MKKLEDRYRTVNTSLDEAFERAITSHINGDIDYAKYVCQRILQVDPNNAIARYHLRIIENWRSLPVLLKNLIAPRIRPEAPVIFDVGANNGNTIAAYRTAFPSARIHGFEPDPDLSAKLVGMFAGDDGVRIEPSALGAAESVASFNICRADGNDGIGSFLALNPDNRTVQVLGAETVKQIEVPVTTIDRYCAAHGIEHIDFVKLDVQGYEDECLKGAEGMLARGAITVIQVELLLSDMYSKTLGFYDIEAILRPHGYRLLAIDDVYPRLGAELFQLDAFYAAPGALTVAEEQP